MRRHLPDSGHLQEEDAAYYNKTHSSKHDPRFRSTPSRTRFDCMHLFNR